jgi:hypothetical protein
VKMTATTEFDKNSGNILLAVELNNPTSKEFNGTLEVSAQGFKDVKQSISLSPGANHSEIVLEPNGSATNGKGKATFYFEGQKIETEFSTGQANALAGLFAFGAGNEAIGISLIVIIAIIVLVGIVSGRGNIKVERDNSQKWIK